MRNLALLIVLMGMSACVVKPEGVSEEQYQKQYDELFTLPERVATLEGNSQQLSSDLWAMRADQERMSTGIKDELVALGAKFEKVVDGATEITMQQEILFASGSVKINKDGMKMLRHVAKGLCKLPEGTRIRVVGHTDNVQPSKKLSKRFPDNLELSAARALAVARVLVQSERLDPDQIFVEGHGEFMPVASNTTNAGRAKNRRINIYYQDS